MKRRDFLAASALGVVGLARRARRFASPEELPVDDAVLYVGTYTDPDRTNGIYLLRMDPRSGQLASIASFDAGRNPSFLAIHPAARVLYAVNEVASGAVSACAIGAGGALSPFGAQPSQGSAPCFVSVDRSGRAALVANYDSGSIALLPIQEGGALAPAASVVQHEGHGPNADRQRGPHAHCILSDPTNRFALAADLGADRVFVYRLDAEGHSLSRVGDAVMRAGAGPRHLAFHPTLPVVFVANELDSTVTTLRFDGEHGVLSAGETRSTLPAAWTGTNFPADIHVSPSGRTVYVSNRGHNSIAVFSVAAPGTLTLEQTVSTDGDWPRNFTLDPTGRWLLVANQKSNTIVVFKRDDPSGKLTATGRHITIPSPVCLRFDTHAR